ESQLDPDDSAGAELGLLALPAPGSADQSKEQRQCNRQQVASAQQALHLAHRAGRRRQRRAESHRVKRILPKRGKVGRVEQLNIVAHWSPPDVNVLINSRFGASSVAKISSRSPALSSVDSRLPKTNWNCAAP